MPSQAVVIRDALLALLTPSLTGIVYTTTAKVDTLEEDTDLPALCVCVMRNRAERASPGDLVGEPFMRNEASIVVSVRDKAKTRDAIAAQLDVWTATIKTVTLTASRNDAAPTTGATGLGAAFVDAHEGILTVDEVQEMSPASGGYFFGFAHVEFVMQYHETWPPYVPDAFASVQVSSFPAADMDAAVLPSVASFTASIAGLVMTVTEVASGALDFGLVVLDGANEVARGTVITGFGDGSGGAGTYTVNIAQTVAATAMTAAQPATSIINVPT